MKKIYKIFKTIGLLFRQPSLINLIIESNQSWLFYVTKKKISNLPLISIENFIQPSDYINIQSSYLGGSSLSTDFLLIRSVCKTFNDCEYFEIGTWRGESVMNAAENSMHCTTLNLSKEEIISLGFESKYAELHGFFSKNISKITEIKGNSMNFNFSGLEKKFDVIFIDGNHHFEFVKNDTEKVFENLIHEKSVVIWHDYAYDPETVRNEVLAGIKEGTPKKYHDYLYQVSNTLCAIYIPKHFETITEKFPLTPNLLFNNQISFKKIIDY